MSGLPTSTELLSRLIEFPSVSDTSNVAISEAVSEFLSDLGFSIETTKYIDESGTTKANLVAKREPSKHQDSSTETRGLAYFCHTDVVPAVGWTGPGGDPFRARLENDRIFGRGSCDMKGSLVAMLEAANRVSKAEQNNPLWIVCTADEEVGFQGAKHLVKRSDAYRQIVDLQPMGIIGEPTRLGVVHAHKGIVGFEITSTGRAAHSSLALGVNANERMVPVLQKLLEICKRTRTDPRYQDERFDPPVLSWNFGVSDGAKAVNITPAKSRAWVCFRPMPSIDGEDLVEEVRTLATDMELEFKRYPGGHPIWVDPSTPSVRAMCDISGGISTTVCYGTDGGEFNELQKMVVFGPGDIAQAHTTDEYLELEQLRAGADLFEQSIRHWCT